MLQRQKILLRLLNKSRSEVPRIVLVKLAFLLRQDSSFKKDSTFYDFVPYKYGPFSFVLYKEMGALERDGYITCNDLSVKLAPKLYTESKAKANELKYYLRAAIDRTVIQFGNLKQNKLLHYVYHHFPWYATSSELKTLHPGALPSRPVSPLAIYTVGYEGVSVDTLFDNLLKHGIQAILDVRANPVSRKYGFARKTLGEIAAKLGVKYHHLPELGIDSSSRDHLSNRQSFLRLLDRYEKQMLPKRQQAVAGLVNLLKKRPSVLLCFEKDAEYCHRSRLASAAAKAGDIKVVHMQS